MFFTFNFFFELFLARNRCAYVFGLLGIVDLVTIVPIFVAMGTGNLKNSPTGFVRFYRLLVLSRVSHVSGYIHTIPLRVIYIMSGIYYRTI